MGQQQNDWHQPVVLH